MKYLWLEVTLDALELPVIVADTSGELARMTNVEPRSIYRALWRYNHGITKKCKYRKVPVEDDFFQDNI